MKARSLAVLLALAVASAAACARHGTAEGLRDALLSSEADAASFAARAPDCPADGHRATRPCLDAVATWLGSLTGFHDGEPDQAGAATAALFALRGHGETVPTPSAWLYTLREGHGAGADALRLAVALRIEEATEPVARSLASESDARALMRAVAASLPGACDTYALLGAGVDDKTLPPESRVDHSPCVQADLDRPTGPPLHGRYGSGPWRGAEGALAAWKDFAGGLRSGLAGAGEKTRAAVAPRLDAIDAAIAKIATVKLAPPPDYSAFLTDAHGDAGVPLLAPAPPPPPNPPRKP